MIKYLGSKRTLIPVILDAVARTPKVSTVLDLFSGTSRVGHFATDSASHQATDVR